MSANQSLHVSSIKLCKRGKCALEAMKILRSSWAWLKQRLAKASSQARVSFDTVLPFPHSRLSSGHSGSSVEESQDKAGETWEEKIKMSSLLWFSSEKAREEWACGKSATLQVCMCVCFISNTDNHLKYPGGSKNNPHVTVVLWGFGFAFLGLFLFFPDPCASFVFSFVIKPRLSSSFYFCRISLLNDVISPLCLLYRLSLFLPS